MRLHYLALFAPLCVLSGQGTLSGPSLGIFFDPQAQTLRKIWGIPGSAVAGENLDIGFSPSQAIVSPSQNYAFVESGDGSLSLVLLGPTAIVPQMITGLPPAPDRIEISPAGQAVAFAYGTSVKVLTGLPESLDRIEEIDLSTLPGPPAAIALSDDGAVLMVSVASDPQTSSAGGVFVFNRGDNGPRLLAASPASDLSFFPDSHDALITDQTSNSVTALQDTGGVAASQWVFVDDRLPDPGWARASLDGDRILLVGAKSGLVAVLDRKGSNPVLLSCTCSPDRIRPLNKFVYRLTEPNRGLLWILDLSHDPQLLFVPIPPVSGESQ